MPVKNMGWRKQTPCDAGHTLTAPLVAKHFNSTARRKSLGDENTPQTRARRLARCLECEVLFGFYLFAECFEFRFKFITLFFNLSNFFS